MFEKIVWSSRFIESKFDGGQGGVSNSCNSEWNSVLNFFIVRTDYELNEREQIALGLFGFLENSLLLFFVKVMLTLNDQRGSLEQDDCEFS